MVEASSFQAVPRICFTIHGQPASRITYIYALEDPDGRIRYIGKADDPKLRFSAHLCDCSDTHKARWIRSLRAVGSRPELRILAAVEFESWQDAERYWMAKARADGACLTNSTAGGRGPLKPVESTRLKMRAAKVGKPLRPEHIAKVSQALKGKSKPRRTADHIRALSSACLGREISPEQRLKLAKANMRRPATAASGFKGVYFDKKRDRWRAYITINKKIKHLGRFGTAIEAATAYNSAAVAAGWPSDGLNPI